MLEHPNIVRIHEVSDHDEIYIVSEFIFGEPLKERIRSERFPFCKSAELMIRIAEAAHYAHCKGVIHRDLKPANILLDADGEPHITDFGMAKLMAGDFTLTVTGDVLGTPAYMSPEQARGESHKVDARSDLFSLGVILYEMLSGKKPFSSSSQIQLLQQIQSRDPRSLRTIDENIPRDLETICLKAMAKSPERRYNSAKDFADDLQRYLRGQAIFARPESGLEQGVRWIRRNRSLAIGGLLAMFTTAMAFQIGLHGRESQRIAPIEVIRPITVEIETDPPGASIVYVPRDKFTGEPNEKLAVRPIGKTPVSVDLLPGDYYVVAKLDDGRFHEVQRYVPKTANEFVEYYVHRSWTTKETPAGTNEAITLSKIKIPLKDVVNRMAEFEGDPFFPVGTDVDKHPRAVLSFYLDIYEVTIQEYLSNNDGNFPRNLKPDIDFPTDFPLTHLPIDCAIEYAESIGKRLPTEFEYEFAATNGGTTLFPWGDEPLPSNDELCSVTQKTQDRTNSIPPVFGLLSNGLEFTDSWYAPFPAFAIAAQSMMPSPGHHVTIRGGNLDQSAASARRLQKIGSRFRTGLARSSTVNDRIGFRGARSKRPQW